MSVQYAEREIHMSKERLEEILDSITFIAKSYTGVEPLIEYAKEQAERVQELENRNKELEYASKYNGELNEFLQKKKLPPKTLGRHVVDVVMDYVQELEHGKEHLELIKERQEEEYRSLYQKNKRYREAIQESQKELKDNPVTAFNILKAREKLNEALEESE